MANTRLRRDVSSSGSDTKGTISAWVKRSKLGTNQVFICGKKSNTERVAIGFSSEDRFEIQFQDTSNAYNWRTNALYRDTSGWYNCVIQLDTGNATATSRARVWINNEEITSWNVQETVPQNLSIGFSSSNNVPHVGARGGVTVDKYFDGIISHLHFIDATAYDATAFGQYDANGVWTIKTSPSVTYGTNGFFILKDGNSVTDQSPNTNNFTVADGTLTKTEDNPSNVFATLNAINNYYPNNTLSNGNTSFSQPASTYPSTGTTLGMVPNSGKFYAEMKCTYVDGWGMVGIFGTQPTASGDDIAKEIDGYTYLGGSATSGSAQKRNNSTNASYDSTFTTNDIISVAVDLVNYKIYFGKNGTWLNSGDPTSGSTGTGAAYTISQTPSSGAYFFGAGNWDGDQGFNGSWNFGNGYFGTTAVASAGTNASGIGIFEYDVPTGYTALSTKGLNL